MPEVTPTDIAEVRAELTRLGLPTHLIDQAVASATTNLTLADTDPIEAGGMYLLEMISSFGGRIVDATGADCTERLTKAWREQDLSL